MRGCGLLTSPQPRLDVLGLLNTQGNIIQPSLFLDSQGHVALLARERGPRIDKNMQDGHIVISRSNR